MTSQGSNHSQASGNNNKSVAQSHPLSTRSVSFLKHNYHQIHLLQKPNNHGVVLEHGGFPEEAHLLIDILNNHFLNSALTLIREDVPSTYLMKFWLSSHAENVENHGECINGYATH